MPFQRLNGFRDFLPPDALKRDHLFSVWKKCAGSFGFSPYDGPPLEPLELYKEKSGDEIVGQLYHFVDKGERAVAMRPEMTPTLARIAGAVHRQYKKPLKWYSIPQVFRYERPQKGRLREHFQWNCDIIGDASAAADAELLALLIESLRQLGLEAGTVCIRISDRRLWSAFMDKHGIVDEGSRYEFLQTLDKMERVPESETRSKLGALAGEVFATMEQGHPTAELEEILGRLQAMGLRDYVEIDYSIVRGLAYYTGTVFEAHERSGQSRAIAGGGRYDHLLEQLSGESLPALGFGMGDVVISNLLEENGLWPEQSPGGLFIVAADTAQRDDVLVVAAALRAAGIRAEYSLSDTKMGKQFQQAEDRGYSKSIVLDNRFTAQQIAAFKNLKTREHEDVRLRIENGLVTVMERMDGTSIPLD